jgi:hypothetical protein
LNDGVKHFLIVGVGFAFAGAWLLTLIVNGIVGTLLERILGAPPEKYYLGSLFLTAVAICIIGFCEVVGNRFFRARFSSSSFSSSATLLSSALFAALVLVFVSPELYQLLGRFADNARYFSRHGTEFLMMLSLPLARLVLLPLIHFAVASTMLIPRIAPNHALEPTASAE